MRDPNYKLEMNPELWRYVMWLMCQDEGTLTRSQREHWAFFAEELGYPV